MLISPVEKDYLMMSFYIKLSHTIVLHFIPFVLLSPLKIKVETVIE